jgi:hypothetical protein
MAKASKIIPLAAVLLLIALVLPVPTAHVAEAYIPPSDVWVAPPPIGDDINNDGTEAHPFATIKKGLDNVAQDGTVHVAAGTYHEHQLPYHYGQDLVGAGAQNTIINGDGIGPVLSISSGPWQNIISGFTIQNGSALTSLWNPADAQVLYAGIKLPPIKMLQQLFNGVPYQGGGIYISGGHSVTLNDCVIKDNQADEGGGIYNEGQLTMNRCTVSGNSAIYAGGGIYNSETANLINCTISGNSLTASDGLGAGIYTSYHLELCNVTLAYNNATGAASKGGGIASMPGNLTAFFKNCIVAHNTAGTAGTNNAYYLSADDMVSQGNNIDSENSCNFDQPTDQINTDPLLGPLQDNGGPTFTHALLHGSPAIDAGANTGAPDTDQRGVPRPQGPAFDIGAYELTQASVTTATNTGTASFSTLNGYITDLTALDELQTGCGPKPGLDFPFGLFSFTVTGITPGSTVTIVIILPSNAPTNIQYWKCINGQWVDCTSLLGSIDGDNVLTLTITDGGLGDRDGQANGEISDPGGPARAVPTQAGPGVSPTIPRPLNPPQMSLQYLSVNPQQTTANQPVTITTNVVNTGDEAGNINITLTINGQVEQSRMVSVGPQGTQPIEFTVTKAQPGTYNVNILDKSGSFTILGSGGTTGAPVNSGLIVILIIGVLVLATVLVLVLSRRPA